MPKRLVSPPDDDYYPPIRRVIQAGGSGTLPPSLMGTTLDIKRADEIHLLTHQVHQHVVGHDEYGETVGLVLPGLPRHRLLKIGEVTGDAGGASFENLQQCRATGLGPARGTGSNYCHPIHG
ncbi:hypothetical protein [Mycobacterium sp. URHB0021]